MDESSSQVVLVNGEQKEKFKPSSMRVNRTSQCCVCLGMQLTCIEFARHVLGLKGQFIRIDPETKYPIIDIMRDQIDVEDMEERSVSALTHLNSNEDQKQLPAMTIKKWCNVAVTVMSLTMLSVNSSKKQDLSSGVSPDKPFGRNR